MPRRRHTHLRDVWNAPGWVFAPGITYTAKQAARFLGIHAVTLIRHTDNFGLTVYRGSMKDRHYLVSEVIALKKAMRSVTKEQIERVSGKEGYGLLQAVSQEEGKRRHRSH